MVFQRIQSQQPVTVGFALTSEGDVNVNGKRIRFTADPIDNEDCVNKRYLMETKRETMFEMKKLESQLNTEISKALQGLDKKFSSSLLRIDRLTKTEVKNIDTRITRWGNDLERKIHKGDEENEETFRALLTASLNSYKPWLEVENIVNTKISKSLDEIEKKISKSVNAISKLSKDMDLANDKIESVKKDGETKNMETQSKLIALNTYCDTKFDKLEKDLKKI